MVSAGYLQGFLGSCHKRLLKVTMKFYPGYASVRDGICYPRQYANFGKLQFELRLALDLNPEWVARFLVV